MGEGGWAACKRSSSGPDKETVMALAPLKPALATTATNAPEHSTGIPPVVDSKDGTAATGSCSIVLPQMSRGETLMYEFGVAPKSDMSLLLLLRARGGSVMM